MSELLHDSVFYYAVAFVIFMGIVYRFARHPALAWLDDEIAKIGAELDQAKQLRAEADAVLASCKERQATAEADAKAIVAQAKRQVEDMRTQAESDLQAYLQRQEKLAAERIAMAEAEAIAQVRTAAIDSAVSMARQSLMKNLPDADAARLADAAVAEISALRG